MAHNKISKCDKSMKKREREKKKVGVDQSFVNTLNYL